MGHFDISLRTRGTYMSLYSVSTIKYHFISYLVLHLFIKAYQSIHFVGVPLLTEAHLQLCTVCPPPPVLLGIFFFRHCNHRIEKHSTNQKHQCCDQKKMITTCACTTLSCSLQLSTWGKMVSVYNKLTIDIAALPDILVPEQHPL